METTDKLCPFRAFGPCPGPQCQFWVPNMNTCALVVQLLRDTELLAMQKLVEDWKELAEEAEKTNDLQQEAIRELGERVANMVDVAVWEADQHRIGQLVEQVGELEREHDSAVSLNRDLKAQLAEMVPRAELEEMERAMLGHSEMRAKAERELADARAELEKARAEGGEEAGGGKKPPKRKRK